MTDTSTAAEQQAVDNWNAAHPVDTPVRYWPGQRDGYPRRGRTRTAAWLVGGQACVSVTGYSGGIALTHVEALEVDGDALRDLAEWLVWLDNVEDPEAMQERRYVTLHGIISRAREALADEAGRAQAGAR